MSFTIRKPVLERFLAKVQRDHKTGCWNWTASVRPDGYGQFTLEDGVNVRAHRISFELWRGPIPPGMTLDHLCRNRRCVNPRHLDPCTRGENVLRGEGFPAVNARKPYCPRCRSSYTTRSDGTRFCKPCENKRIRDRYRTDAAFRRLRKFRSAQYKLERRKRCA